MARAYCACRRCGWGCLDIFLSSIFSLSLFGRCLSGGGRVVRWCWVNFQCRGVLQFGWLVVSKAFNDIWETGNVPKSWKEATIIPIPKPGKDNANPNNYRPIALTCCICKTLERMINERLVWYLETNNIITEFRSGFRHQRSTNDHLVKLETLFVKPSSRRST